MSQVRLLGTSYDATSDATTMIVEATMPDILGEGGYLLEIDVIDTISGDTAQQTMPFLITASAETFD